MPNTEPNARELTMEETRLIEWMLQHGTSEALAFLDQLPLAHVAPWRCKCGCASFNLIVQGHANPTGNMTILGDFVYGEDKTLTGIFVYARNGVLAGVEVYGFSDGAPTILPRPEILKPFSPTRHA